MVWTSGSYLGQDGTIKGSCESLRRKCPLNFDDLSTAVSLVPGRRHGKQEE